MRRQLVEEEGLEAVLSRKAPARSSVPRIFDGEKEARLIALACSQPPAGARALEPASFGEQGGRAWHCRGRREVNDPAGSVRNLVRGPIIAPMEGEYGDQEGHAGRSFGWPRPEGCVFEGRSFR